MLKMNGGGNIKILLVIPCYNEARNLPRLFEEIKNLRKKLMLLL